MAEGQEQEPAAWERQPGEPIRWFTRFTSFRLMGPGRSLMGCVNKERVQQGKEKYTKGVAYSWSAAAAKWRWRERALAWDKHVLAEEERLQEERRREWRQKEWDYAQRLLAAADVMLKFPLMRTEQTRTEADGKVQITNVILPADWRLTDVSHMIGMASKLARLATDMETDKKQAEIKIEEVELSKDERNRALSALADTISDLLLESGEDGEGEMGAPEQATVGSLSDSSL